MGSLTTLGGTLGDAAAGRFTDGLREMAGLVGGYAFLIWVLRIVC